MSPTWPAVFGMPCTRGTRLLPTAICTQHKREVGRDRRSSALYKKVREGTVCGTPSKELCCRSGSCRRRSATPCYICAASSATREGTSRAQILLLFFLVNVPRAKHLWRNSPSVLLYETPIGGKIREGISGKWRVSLPCQKGEREVGRVEIQSIEMIFFVFWKENLLPLR